LSFVSRKTLHEIRFTLYALNLARIIHDSSTAIADPLLRQACGRRARSSDLRRTARVRLRSSGLRAPVSRRGLAISPRTLMKNAG